MTTLPLEKSPMRVLHARDHRASARHVGTATVAALTTWLALAGCNRGAQEPSSPHSSDTHPPTTPTAPAPAATPAPSGPTGAVEGIVSLTGTLPPPHPAVVDPETARRAGCEEAGRDYYGNYFGVTAPGAMPEAIVTVDAHTTARPPVRRRMAIFRDCSIVPRILAVALGDTLVLRSETSQHHLPKVDGQGATIAQLLRRGEDQEKFIERPGRYILHSVNFPTWMQTPLVVTPNPFYDQTDREGHFRIEHLPPGTYTMHAWFPNTTPVDASVTIRANETAHQNFSLTPLPPEQIRPNQPDNLPTRPTGPVIP